MLFARDVRRLCFLPVVVFVLSFCCPLVARADSFVLDTSSGYAGYSSNFSALQPVVPFEFDSGRIVEYTSTSTPDRTSSTSEAWFRMGSLTVSSTSTYSSISYRTGFNGTANGTASPVVPAGYRIIPVLNRTAFGFLYSLSNGAYSLYTPTTSAGPTNWYGFRVDGSSFLLQRDIEGFLVASEPLYAVGFVTTGLSLYAGSLGSHNGYWCFKPPTIVVSSVEDTSAVVDAVETQTETLMGTNGSSDIVSGATQGGEDGLLDRLGFVGTALSVPAAIFEGITGEEDSTIEFPGVSVELPGGTFTIPSGSVNLWQNFPAMETPVRTGCTFVCILAWLHGVHALYGRIVHGDKDVITE